MIFALADFSVIKPDFGLLFWTVVVFLLFWFLIGKTSFKAIGEALRKRETDIQDALDAADRAKAEMANLQAENDRLLAEAREEKVKILKEAKETSTRMVNEAKDKAKAEANKILESARNEINTQKQAAMQEVTNEVGSMALQIAEKVLRKELSTSGDHKNYVNQLVKEIQLN